MLTINLNLIKPAVLNNNKHISQKNKSESSMTDTFVRSNNAGSISFMQCPPCSARAAESFEEQLARQARLAEQAQKERMAKIEAEVAKNLSLLRNNVLNIAAEAARDVAGFVLEFANLQLNWAKFNPLDVLEKTPRLQTAMQQSSFTNDPVMNFVALSQLKTFGTRSKTMDSAQLLKETGDIQAQSKNILLRLIKDSKSNNKLLLSEEDRKAIDGLYNMAESSEGLEFGPEFEEKLQALLERQRKIEKRKLKVELGYNREIIVGKPLSPQMRTALENKLRGSNNEIEKEAINLMLESNREISFNAQKLSAGESEIRQQSLQLGMIKISSPSRIKDIVVEKQAERIRSKDV